MIKLFFMWLSKRGIIKIRALMSNSNYYCPLCLSDIEKGTEESVRCHGCGTKVYFTED